MFESACGPRARARARGSVPLASGPWAVAAASRRRALDLADDLRVGDRLAVLVLLDDLRLLVERRRELLLRELLRRAARLIALPRPSPAFCVLNVSVSSSSLRAPAPAVVPIGPCPPTDEFVPAAIFISVLTWPVRCACCISFRFSASVLGLPTKPPFLPALTTVKSWWAKLAMTKAFARPCTVSRHACLRWRAPGLRTNSESGVTSPGDLPRHAAVEAPRAPSPPARASARARAGVRRGEERERRLRRGVVELHERDRRVDVRFEPEARPRRSRRAVRARGALEAPAPPPRKPAVVLIHGGSYVNGDAGSDNMAWSASDTVVKRRAGWVGRVHQLPRARRPRALPVRPRVRAGVRDVRGQRDGRGAPGRVGAELGGDVPAIRGPPGSSRGALAARARRRARRRAARRRGVRLVGGRRERDRARRERRGRLQGRARRAAAATAIARLGGRRPGATSRASEWACCRRDPRASPPWARLRRRRARAARRRRARERALGADRGLPRRLRHGRLAGERARAVREAVEARVGVACHTSCRG